MRMTYQTDYALRMLMYLAAQKAEAPCTVNEVAMSYGLSRNHLLKVARRLADIGVIKTTRGRSGGIALAKAPQEIGVGEVVRAMEDDFALVECMHPNGGGCAISPACRLKSVMHEALEAYLSVFDEYSLADLSQNAAELVMLLECPATGCETSATSA